MSSPVLEAAPAPAPTNPNDLGIDRAFLLQMARMPALALLWVAAGIAGHHVWAAFRPEGLNCGPLVVIGFAMILAAFIDGWALKVPNWITLPLVLSGWMIGALHDFGVTVDAGTGGFGMSVAGTFLGFALLFPMLLIRGVGEGDVKMQMGFGAWVAAFFGNGDETGLHGLAVVFWAFCFGAIVGGAFGMVIILIRGKFRDNAQFMMEVMGDLQKFGAGKVSVAQKQAQERRSRWTKLPYGIPLCVGFLMYLLYVLAL